MAELHQDSEDVYVEHQYMCSECHQLFNTLEDVLIHQQIHTGQEGEGEGDLGEAMAIEGVSEMGQGQQYQCLECGAILVNPEELLQHQEMHMREAGMEVEQGNSLDVLVTLYLISTNIYDNMIISHLRFCIFVICVTVGY